MCLPHAAAASHGRSIGWISRPVNVGRRSKYARRTVLAFDLSVLAVAPDAQHYVHSYSRLLTDLFLVHGLR